MRNKGFTLVEISVVVGIIILLTGIAIMSGSSAKSAARDNQRKTDLRLIQLKLEAYRELNGSYPRTNDLYDDSLGIKNLPKDPKGPNYFYVPLSIGGECGASYYLYTYLEGDRNSQDPEILNFLVPCAGSEWPQNKDKIFAATSPEAFLPPPQPN